MDQKWYRPGVEFALAWAQETMGKLNAALGKSGRWGFGSFDPTKKTGGEKEVELNVDWVLREIGDARDALYNLESQILANLGTLRKERKNGA